jgi:hypothetical protein
MKNKVKNYTIIFCVIYTAATLCSSILYLCVGQETDTNFHLINRAVIVLIGTLTLAFALELKFKCAIFNYTIPYFASMPLCFLYVWLCGLFDELAKSAYLDIFLNFTIFYIIVCVIVFFVDKANTKKQEQKGVKNNGQN